MKILLAEDEAQLNRVLTVAMQKSGYDVDSVFNGQEAVDAVKEHPYDVIIMDIMMPVKNGLDAVKEIRATGDKTYIMMLTAKSEIDDKVTGLDVGADDYLTKPFSLKELLARLRSKERRSDEYSNQELNYDNLKLDLNAQELSSNNSISLSKQETGLMRYFLLNPNKAISTEELFNHVWKDEDESEDVVWVYISFLRSKLASIGANVRITGEKGGEFCLERA
ncbi:transcriptional regulator [Lactobacillus nasalidis]|uniref:Transcriptional regulator n=1 Tax=Lactobacillus nasalidis TaxID=2797258 RepID=A0ABQ3W5A3_9LACO|nr:response regulator transcription factor [Lactobacillus nasalidis]GHV97772.1 transcriptional regulator [Lactobacillus nasalidis]GHV99091.1 transcriptional regulator [Lactobacillus nasalidis]GHW01631.1 transcriptional regulator [Lactobacillus nasalidis]